MYALARHWQGKTALSLLLLPLSWVYCLAVVLRRRLYRACVIPSVALPVPVVVVGNVTVGGTGKTPLVIWLVDLLRGAGLRVGVVTRGYGGRSATWPVAVHAQTDPDLVGDEPVLIARLARCPVVAGPDRVAAARRLVDEQGCDVIVSDDGLQHYRLARNFEIAVIDGERRFGNRRCLPAGPLREPVARLRSVDVCVTNGRPEAGELGMRLVETGIANLAASERTVGVEQLRASAVHAIAGIGHPPRFFAALRACGLTVIEHAFPDHHRFAPEDLEFGDELPIIMTGKDAVKCQRFARPNYWVWGIAARPDPRLAELTLAAVRKSMHG